MNGLKTYSVILYYIFPIVINYIWAIMKVTIFNIKTEDYFAIVMPLGMCALSIVNIIYYVVLLNYIITAKYANNIVFILIESFVFEQVIQHCTFSNLLKLLLLNFLITFLSMNALSILANRIFNCQRNKQIKKNLYINYNNCNKGLILSYIIPIICHLFHTIVYTFFESYLKILFIGYKPIEYLYISIVNIFIYIGIYKINKRSSFSFIIIESVLFYLFTILFI